MSVVLRWKAKSWEDAPIMCRIFGHKWTAGWWGDIPYLSLKNPTGNVDGVGREHWTLTCHCDRCDKQTTVARMHKPYTLPVVTNEMVRQFILGSEGTGTIEDRVRSGLNAVL